MLLDYDIAQTAGNRDRDNGGNGITNDALGGDNGQRKRRSGDGCEGKLEAKLK